MPHVILLASDHLGVRILEQLRRDGCDVTVAVPEGSWLSRIWLPEHPDVFRIDSARPRIAAVAGLATADALLAVTDEDELNLGAALEALKR